MKYHSFYHILYEILDFLEFYGNIYFAAGIYPFWERNCIYLLHRYFIILSKLIIRDERCDPSQDTDPRLEFSR